jgi:hypothetical protein
LNMAKKKEAENVSDVPEYSYEVADAVQSAE